MNKNSSWETSVKPVVVLSVIALIVSLLLAMVNSFTAPIIEENQKAATLAAYVDVMPTVSSASDLEEVTDYTTENITGAVKATDGSLAIKAEEKGFDGGILSVIIGFDTNGTVTVEVFSNGVLGDEASVADQLQAGTLDMARISTTGMAPSCPALRAASMPFLFATDQAKYDAFDGEFGQALTEAVLEDTGIVNLTYFFATARSFYTVDKPITCVADMAGLKIRSQEDPIVMAMFEALGAKATPMNYSEVYSALETKIVDGAENDMTSYYTSGHYEVAPYYSLDKHTALGSLFCISGKAWDSLSADQQDALKKAA